MDAIIEAARESSRILQQFCDECMSDEPDAGAHQVSQLFLQSLKATRAATRVYASVNANESFFDVLSELTAIMALFEQVLAHHGATELLNVYDPVNPPGFSGQLRELRAQAFPVYHSYVIRLREAHRTWRFRSQDSSENADALSRMLPQIERLVRRMSEVHLTEHFDSKDQHQNNPSLSFFDRYSYGIKENDIPSSTARSLCLWQLVRMLQESDLSQLNKGDISRLCYLIKGLERSWNSSHGKLCKEVDRILDDILPGLQHRDHIRVSIPNKNRMPGGGEDMDAQKQGSDPSRPRRRSSQRTVRRTVTRA